MGWHGIFLSSTADFQLQTSDNIDQILPSFAGCYHKPEELHVTVDLFGCCYLSLLVANWGKQHGIILTFKVATVL